MASAPTLGQAAKRKQPEPAANGQRNGNGHGDGRPANGRGGKRRDGGGRNPVEDAARRRARAAELVAARMELPISAVRDQLVAEARACTSLVVVAETGSGKTTQLPQFLLAAGLGPVAVTQPRRVAAVAAATRVAEESGAVLGGAVGYAVRFDDRTCESTVLRYVTDGLLLREALSDPRLSRYGAIVLDEAHERSLHSDVLLAVLKRAAALRGSAQGQAQAPSASQSPPPPLRLVVMSATLCATSLAAYLGPGARVLSVAGRQHPVAVWYTATPQPDYLEAAVTAVLQVHREQPPGDVLVFLTGADEIDAAARLIKDRSGSTTGITGATEGAPSPLPVLCLLPVPLYAALTPEQQARAFAAAPRGVRKVVLATNIAETSLTIPGVRYVIDCGFVKARSFAAATGADALAVAPISKAQARQRSGRAGREGPGVCYRLYTESAFVALAAEAPPEISRVSLAGAVLQLKAMGVVDVASFDWLEPPPPAALARALEQLLALGALDTSGGLTTPVGHAMARLPLEPSYARALLAAGPLGVALQAAAVAAMFSVEAPFLSPRADPGAAVDAVGALAVAESRSAKRLMASPGGDAVTLLAVFRAYLAVGDGHGQRAAWCRRHFVSGRALSRAAEIEAQLRGHASSVGLDLTGPAGGGSGGDADADTDLVGSTPLRKSLAAGFFLHAARAAPGGGYRLLRGGQVIHLHPSSVLFGTRPPPECVVFRELVQTAKRYARDATVIDAAWLPELAPRAFVIARRPEALE